MGDESAYAGRSRDPGEPDDLTRRFLGVRIDVTKKFWRIRPS